MITVVVPSTAQTGELQLWESELLRALRLQQLVVDEHVLSIALHPVNQQAARRVVQSEEGVTHSVGSGEIPQLPPAITTTTTTNPTHHHIQIKYKRSKVRLNQIVIIFIFSLIGTF